MFTTRRTDRLLIRPLREGDEAELVARRNQPDVARYDSYELPFTLDQARRLVAEQVALGGPQDGEWWLPAVCDAATGETYGALGIRLTSAGRTAQIGYSFATAHWGRGYATEAVADLVEYAFGELGVTRVFAVSHPGNVASAMVLERTGFLFEAHHRSAYWKGDVCSDGRVYAMIPPDREAWRHRPRHPPGDVGLVEVTVDNVDVVAALRTHKSQERFVATMAESFTDALFPEVVDGAPVVPWMRAVEADGEVAGFVMLALRTEHHPEPFLWRLLIDRRHQRRGIGGRGLDLVVAECRAMGDAALLTSWSEGKGSPRPFYERYGFEPTGRVVDGETEARLRLA